MSSEYEEIQSNIERLRSLLESLIVRGLRACGPDELAQLRSFTEHLEGIGAGHVAAMLGELGLLIQNDNPAAARKLLEAQTAVRLLERLLTLRVVRGEYQAAVAALDNPPDAQQSDDGDDTDEDITEE